MTVGNDAFNVFFENRVLLVLRFKRILFPVVVVQTTIGGTYPYFSGFIDGDCINLIAH